MTKIKTDTPLLGFTAYSGTGKTTLLVKLIPILKNRGIKIGVIKHAHHHFEIDHPGKDSYKIRNAGACYMLIGSKHRWALMVEQDEIDSRSRFEEYLSHLDQDNLDIIMVEGFKMEAMPKIELHRPSLNQDLIYENDNNVMAIATDEPFGSETNLPILDLNNHEQIADFIINRFCKKKVSS